MNPIVSIINNVFPDPNSLKRLILKAGFSDVVSPVDGVTYPGICMELPDIVKAHVVQAIINTMLQPIIVNHMFARIMPSGVEAPHKMHGDSMMGQYSALIYLSSAREGFGTGFYSHAEHGIGDNGNPTYLGDAHQSMKGWNQYLYVHAAFNRMVIHGADYYHCALPTHGFGTKPSSARMVISTFFSLP